VKIDCVFCDILGGAMPASVVYEDAQALAFLDLYPVHPGHALVVPKAHVTDLAACPAELAGHLFAVSGRLGPVLCRTVGGDGFNVWTANGSAAGQEVFHLHLHVLPRFRDDSFGLRFPKSYPEATTRQELDTLAGRIRSLL
jgi:histidine triad (HIT) family protein